VSECDEEDSAFGIGLGYSHCNGASRRALRLYGMEETLILPFLPPAIIFSECGRRCEKPRRFAAMPDGSRRFKKLPVYEIRYSTGFAPVFFRDILHQELHRNITHSCTLTHHRAAMKPPDILMRGNVMKAITAIAAAALLAAGVTVASAQTPSSSASKPGSTTNTDPEVPAKGASPSNSLKATGSAGSAASGTTGSGSHATGVTKGSNPNPTTNKNPDPEVPGKKQN
jgi:hypothetical protein